MDTGFIDTVREAPGNWWNRLRAFLSEVRQELKRVTWPSRREVYATTIVVILTSLFFGLYLFLVDLVLSTGVNQLFKALGVA